MSKIINYKYIIKNINDLINAIDLTEQIATEVGFDQKEVIFIKLAAEEAFSNAYEYSLVGHQNPVNIYWDFSNKYFKVVIKHIGKCSDFKINPSIVYGKRGRGLKIIYSLMDHILLQQSGEYVELIMEKVFNENIGGEKMETILQSHTSVLSWSEDITIKSVSKFKNTIEEFLQNDAAFLVLDLENVQYVNSSGLGVMAESVMKCRKVKKELVISSVSGTVNKIFSIVKFGNFIKLFKTKEEAIEYGKNNF